MNAKNVDRTWTQKTRMQKSHTGKGDIRYWQKRVRRAGSRGENAFYSVSFQHGGRRMEMSLGTPNQMEAAGKAKERYFFLIANGWEAFLARYRAKEALATTPDAITVGEFLAAVSRDSELGATTVDGYARRLRQIVADVAGIKGAKARHDYRKGGYRTWTDAVHAVPLASVTPDKVREWKKRFIDSAGKNEVKRRSRTVSCNSMLRQARALFSRKNVLDKLKIDLPAPLPFDGVNVERRSDVKFYGCGVDARALLRDAAAELGTDRPEEFKAFLLALVLGLRRREADMLEWQSFDFAAGTVRIQPTKWYALKTRESASTLPVEPQVLALFRAWRAKAKSEFVIESVRLPKSVSYQWYRCSETFDSLLAWLRAKGVQGQKPIHNLRKLYGSEMANLHGIHVASSSLRHADIGTTAAFYADRSVKLTAGFASELGGASVTPFPDASKASSRGGQAAH
jgi:integrase